MSNILYLACRHHPEKIHCLRLAMRSHAGYVAPRMLDLQLAKFFAEHATCGGGFDHFTVAYDEGKDHDLPKPIVDAVRATLRNAAEIPAANEPTP